MMSAWEQYEAYSLCVKPHGPKHDRNRVVACSGCTRILIHLRVQAKRIEDARSATVVSVIPIPFIDLRLHGSHW